mmetsp:Transcript_35529/g.55848  ORF Transcript_35529/g.55848 Transcript_35529/m.55848 type:complete len:239 (-) Transcript_35529:180-896(-)
MDRPPVLGRRPALWRLLVHEPRLDHVRGAVQHGARDGAENPGERALPHLERLAVPHAPHVRPQQAVGREAAPLVHALSHNGWGKAVPERQRPFHLRDARGCLHHPRVLRRRRRRRRPVGGLQPRLQHLEGRHDERGLGGARQQAGDKLALGADAAGRIGEHLAVHRVEVVPAAVLEHDVPGPGRQPLVERPGPLGRHQLPPTVHHAAVAPCMVQLKPSLCNIKRSQNQGLNNSARHSP